MNLLKRCLVVSVLLLMQVMPFCPQAHGRTFEQTYQAFLDKFVKQGKTIEGFHLNVVDYDEIIRDRLRGNSLYVQAVDLLKATSLDNYSTREARIAFWVNVYNIGAIKMIIDHYPVSSIRSRNINFLKQPWDMKIIKVGENEYSLGQIEHEILLARYQEQRVHFAIVCASLSCPQISGEVYAGDRLAEQLDDAARIFLNDSKKGFKIDKAKGIAYFSQIFKFDKKSFPAGARDAIPLIKKYIGKEEADYLDKGEYKIKYLDYDWSLNTFSRAE